MPYTVIQDVVIQSEAGSVHYPAGSTIGDDLPETAELLASGKIVPEGQEPVEAVELEEPRQQYTVVEEFIVNRGDTAVHISEVGSTVELTDTEAAAAGSAVAVDGESSEPASTASGDENAESSDPAGDGGESSEPDESSDPAESTEADEDPTDKHRRPRRI